MHEVKLPQLGQSVEEASIVRWLKAEGDSVAKGEPLLAVQTDKAEIECEAPAAGTLRKILVDTDVTVPVMTVIALLGEPHEALPDLSKYGIGGAPEKQTAPAKESSPVTATSPSAPTTAAVATASLASAVSPRARNKAASLHINPSTIPGTGAGGRVMESDVVSFASGMGAATPTAKRIAEQTGADLSKIAGSGPKGKIMKSDIAGAKAAPPVIASGETRSVPLTPMRRIIAQRMADSLFSAPHYYVTVEIDMSNVVKMRASLAWKPSYNDFVMRATAVSLTRFPAVNARWTDDAIVEQSTVNLGFAVALPTGLIVPVVRDAHAKTLQEISQDCKTLTEKARTGKLMPDDYSGNTFTISNLGGFGVDHFTAIINQPDSAILAVGQMKDRVVVIDGGMHIRPIMKVTLSSDHRVIDGALAAQFMGHLKDLLEQAAV